LFFNPDLTPYSDQYIDLVKGAGDTFQVAGRGSNLKRGENKHDEEYFFLVLFFLERVAGPLLLFFWRARRAGGSVGVRVKDGCGEAEVSSLRAACHEGWGWVLFPPKNESIHFH